MGRGVEVEAVRLGDEGASADEEISEAGARGDAGLPVMGRVAIGEEGGLLPFAGEEDALPRHEDVVEERHAGGLPELAAELRRLFARTPRRPRHEGQVGRVDGHRAADGEVLVGLGHVAARHDEELVHVGRAGDDGLHAREDDAVLSPLGDVQVRVEIFLLVGALAPVAAAVGHGDADRQIFVLHALQICVEPILVVAAQPVRRLAERGERIAREVALGAARLLADEPDCFELVEQVLAAGGDVHHAVDGLPLRRGGGHHRRQLGAQREVVGEADGIDARREAWLVGDGGDGVAVDEDARMGTAE